MESDTTSLSGRFVLRIPPGLHAQLRASAHDLGISLNEYCAALLSHDGGVGDAEPLVRLVIEKARATLGDQLAGVVLFGSWARGESTTESDIDVLLVAKPGTPITRSLYNQWDKEPFVWDTRAVEPHIVATPTSLDAVSGLWAEVALDGIVIHDPHLIISRLLASVRRRIVDAHIVRRSSGGQTYWVGAA